MTKRLEILRLNSLGINNRRITESIPCSRNVGLFIRQRREHPAAVFLIPGESKRKMSNDLP